MTRGRTSRNSPAAIAAAEAQKNREDDLRIKNLLDDYSCIVEEKVLEETVNHEINSELVTSNISQNGEIKVSNQSTAANKKTFYTSFGGNTELQMAIFRFLSRDRDRRPSTFTQEDKDKERDTLQKLCKMLISLHRYVSGLAAKPEDNKVPSGRTSYTLASVAKDIEKNRTVVFQYLPYLINIYLCTQQKLQEKRQHKFIETFLLTLYNCEAWTGNKGYSASTNMAASQGSAPQNNNPLSVQNPGSTYNNSPCQHTVTVMVPSLSQSSVYHSHTASDPLERVSSAVGFTTRPFTPVMSVNATTRPHILHLLFHLFNNHIMDLSKSSLELVAKTLINLIGRGHTQTSLHSASRQRGQIQFKRIHLPAPVLVELLTTAHHCIFNGLSTLGNQIVDLVELKAAGNGWPDVLVVVGAMRNLAKTWSGDGTGRGLRAATTDAHYANSPGMQIAKNMITNASFRAKKISEDIPKVVETAMEQHLKAKLMTNMKSITEEIGTDLNEVNDVAGNNSGQQNSTNPTTNTKTPTKNLLESARHTKDKLMSKDKLMAKLPNALGKVGINKHKPDRSERLSDGGPASGGPLSSIDKTGAADSLSPGGNSDIENQSSKAPKTSFEKEAFLPSQSDTTGKKDDHTTGKEDRKKSVFEVRKPNIMKLDKKSAKSEDKERAKNEKKAEEKAAKQEKKREKEAIKNKKIIPEHSSSTLANNSLNASSAGTSRKLYNDELDPSEEYINECDQSGIQMMTFRSTEHKDIESSRENQSRECWKDDEQTNDNDNLDANTAEKVEELIQKKRLPQDQTIAIHSPESGTTFW